MEGTTQIVSAAEKMIMNLFALIMKEVEGTPIDDL